MRFERQSCVTLDSGTEGLQAKEPPLLLHSTAPSLQGVLEKS